MTFKKKRAFHFGGASWLLLCAMADGAMAQAAPPASTQLPEITVTAPSPIVRRKPVPSRTPARVARAAPGQNRERAAEPQPAPVAAAPQQGVLPVVTDQFATVTVVPNEEIRRQRHRPARRSPVLETRHHRLQLRARRLEPADHPRPRRQSRRHRRERHRRRRRFRSRRGPFRADRSTGDQPGRGHPRSGGDALRLDIDRRRRQRDQQSYPGRLAIMRGRTVPDLRTAGKAPLGGSPSCVTVETRTAVSSVDRGVEGGILLDAGGGNFAVHADAYGRKASDYSIPSYPYLFDQTRPVNGRQPNSAMQADGASVGGSYMFDGGFIGARSRRTTRCIASPASTAPITRPGSTRTRPNSRPRANTGRMRRRSTRSGSGPAPPITSTTRSGLPIPPIPRQRRRAADLHQQGAGRPRRGADGAVQRALCRRHDGIRPAGRAPGTDGAEPGRSAARSTACWIRTSNTKVAGYVFNEFKFTRHARRRSPAASSMSISAERRRHSFRNCSTSTSIPPTSVRRPRAI